ncbi:MAG: hypothetical protein RLZZ419_770, partial [Pseudomonadota bacterium]
GTLLGELYAGHDALQSLLLASGYAVSLLLGARLLAFFKFSRSLDTLRDILLLTCSAIIIAVISATLHLQSLNLLGTPLPGDTQTIYTRWFIGDLLGILFVTPAILVFYTPISNSILRHKVLPFIAYCLLCFVLAQAIFFNWFPGWMGWAEGRGALLFLALVIAGGFFGRHGVLLLFSGFLIQALFSGVFGDAFVTTEYLIRPASISIWLFMGFTLFIGMSSTILFQQLKKKNAELVISSKAQKKSEQLFRETLGNAPILMMLFDPKTNLTEYVNPFFTSVLGYTADDFLVPGSWWNSAYPDPAYRSQVISEWAVFTDGVTDTKKHNRKMETWVAAKDGSKKLLSWGMFLVEEKMAIYSFDITEQRSAELQLLTSSALYRAIGEAVLITSSDNSIVLANNHFESLTGFTSSSVIGKSFMDLLVKRHGASSYSDIQSSLSTTGRWEGQIWLRSAKGEDLQQFVSIFSDFDHENSVEQRIILISELTDLRKARELITQQANFDPLTELPNRRLMLDRLDQLLKVANRTDKCVAVIYLDLDNFKEINDSRGHDFGDKLLREVSVRLRSEVRDSDTVARIGGDEFIVLLGGLDRPENADIIIQQLLKMITAPVEIDQQVVYASASFGIAFYPNDGSDAKSLILAADQAMYAAKDQGRNTHYYFTEALQTQANYRSRLVADLRVAIENKQFELLFQPIVDLSTGGINHAEVLLRWRRNDSDLMMPVDFIPAAEDSGLIVDIGDWVMQEAIQFIRELPPDHKVALSVNVSAAQFNSDRHSVTNWIELMTRANLDPSRIVIELTERIMVLNSQRAQRKIKVLQEAGFLFSVDDFGTGYSSLALLRSFDFDFIKIDQHFINNLGLAGPDAPLVQAMISMAKSLGLLAVAEGVEAQEQKDLLLDLGCAYGQGYFFYKPMSGADLKILLSNTATQPLR